MPDRSLQKVVTRLTKSRQLISRWAKKYEWKARAAAYDAEMTEATFEALKRGRVEKLEKKMRVSAQLEEKALKALEALELKRISAHAIVEMLTLSNQLSNEATEEERANDESRKVTAIEIIDGG